MKINRIDVSANKGNVNTQIAPKVQQLKQLADAELPRWQRLSDKGKRELIKSGKHPLLALLWSMYRYLHSNWFSEVGDDDI